MREIEIFERMQLMEKAIEKLTFRYVEMLEHLEQVAETNRIQTELYLELKQEIQKHIQNTDGAHQC